MNNRIVYIALFFIIILGSCTYNELVIIDKRPGADTTQIDTTGPKKLVYFYPRIETLASDDGYASTTVEAFPAGRRVQVFVFARGIQYLMSPIYQSLDAGSLTPVSTPVVIPTGNYDFYFTSINTSSDPPTVENSVVSPVSNGIDYIWASAKVAVETNNTSVPVTFTHSCTQVVFNVINDDTTQLVDWINYAMIQMPDTSGLEWDLYSGEITGLNTTTDEMDVSQSLLDDKINMPASGLMCSQFLVPLEYSGTMAAFMQLKMTTEGGGGYKGYDLTLSIPDGELSAGNSYHYNIYFAKDTVYIGDVEINSWIIVNEEGTPLYPTISDE